MTLNSYTSVKKANVQNKILFVCHDSSVVKLLRPLIEHNDMLALYLLPFSAAPDASYGSYDYALIAHARPQLVYDFVSRQIPLWFSDVDMVWNKNPWPFISDLQGEGHDIVVLKDGPKFVLDFFLRLAVLPPTGPLRCSGSGKKESKGSD
ncbi:hypothetical protein SARC_02985 [Sphaeroforma arctica JP610]|uniref:Nucleotide-diphospho-sugar transferase domain-containing protein n=1 Tax=Sphaeroforma arctica JP610 TaxID=667725 RepID=A0A0L0G720_9EUKA|nr:hypothetical protein SARC_02985 [Sphaeroforma arctica JP610]KNC84810.1 hypothetical protein SARC_02985 [Sphaeroforma arctica JP610]|eukprot:XP_014158712.1 hypothetical protein SARC_02985 [Sphaeroforma arctica JP610]